ncbi:hypothetical protein NM688_g4390 [Phlebia brevispora]|uniref:Uncharacterized protein n=1 Tax=Phlebia brevispora TaxID=194682 RepID=A0ACC1T321_9APHY|nr:hypothetical protein NM688_g4390 [Phlebia brevispora]
MELTEYLDISYSPTAPGPLHEFDLYIPASTHTRRPPLLCFVHGGAWRSEDKADHAELARRLAQLTSYPVAVPNYRLTKPETPLRHPAHTEDLLQFLNFILDWDGLQGLDGRPYDPSRLYVFGHSCSAHMLTSILLIPPTGSASAASHPSRLPRVCSSPFPRYRDWFIAPTFGDLPSYEAFNTASYSLRESGEHIRWMLIHSKGDTLVDVAQTETILARLQDVLAGGKGPGSVQAHWELTSEHNDILKEGDYPRIVANFVIENEKGP